MHGDTVPPIRQVMHYVPMSDNLLNGAHQASCRKQLALVPSLQ